MRLAHWFVIAMLQMSGAALHAQPLAIEDQVANLRKPLYDADPH